MAIAEGCSNERYLRCRYHGRRFGLDGRFQHMPEFEAACNFPSPSDNLPQPPLGRRGKRLFGSVFPETSFEEVNFTDSDRVKIHTLKPHFGYEAPCAPLDCKLPTANCQLLMYHLGTRRWARIVWRCEEENASTYPDPTRLC
jgi:hypothetical protein